MTITEIDHALSLLGENLNRFERLNDPTEYEIAMYRNLWSIICYLKECRAVLSLAESYEAMETVLNVRLEETVIPRYYRLVRRTKIIENSFGQN